MIVFEQIRAKDAQQSPKKVKKRAVLQLFHAKPRANYSKTHIKVILLTAIFRRRTCLSF